MVDVERDAERVAESLDKDKVGVCFSSAEAVVDVDGGETDAEGVTGLGVFGVEKQEEGDGVGATGDCGAEALAGLEVGAIKCGGG